MLKITLLGFLYCLSKNTGDITCFKVGVTNMDNFLQAKYSHHFFCSGPFPLRLEAKCNAEDGCIYHTAAVKSSGSTYTMFQVHSKYHMSGGSN